MNDIFAQKMALRSNALGGIMQAWAQMKQKQDAEEQARLGQQKIQDALFPQSPIISQQIPSNINVQGAMPQMPQQNVPAQGQQQFNPYERRGFVNRDANPTIAPMQPAGFAGTPRQTITSGGQRQFNPTMESLLPLLGNPYTAGRTQDILNGMKTIRDLAPKPYTLSEGETMFSADGTPIASGGQKTKVAWRTVMENGKPKMITQNGLTFAQQEAYDENTGKPLTGYQNDVKKMDDNTYKPSMYDKAGEGEVKSLAQLVANYDADINTIPRQDRTQVFAEAAKINPKFNQINYTANKKLKENYTSGKYSQNIVSFNTAIGHLGDLVTAAEALKNGDIQLLNLLANEYGRQTGESAPDAYEAVRDAVANEMATALKGSSGTDIGLQNILKTMNSKQSPEQAKAVAKQFVTLLDSRLKALNSNYKKQTGVDFPVLDEDKKAIVDKIMGKKKTVTETDIDSMTKEELEAFLKGQ